MLCVTVVTEEAMTCSSTNICAFKGSTVHISCTYNHTSWQSPWSTFWAKKDSDVDLSSNSLQSYQCSEERVNEQLPDVYNYRNTLTITNVSESDSAVYKIWISTSGRVWKVTAKPGVRLTVPVSGNSQHVC